MKLIDSSELCVTSAHMAPHSPDFLYLSMGTVDGNPPTQRRTTYMLDQRHPGMRLPIGLCNMMRIRRNRLITN